MTPTRRAVLTLPGLLALPKARADQPIPGAGLLLALLSDPHSAMERAPALLGALDAALAANAGIPAFILVNGDCFERGNAVALRSAGAADWAFLAALRRRAPVVLNIGNHETALEDDLAVVVRRLRAMDITVLTNLVDRRTGQPFADPALRLTLPGGRRLVIAGLGTDEATTYRPAARALMEFPSPVAWARASLPALLAEAETRIVMSHAGVVPDRAILPLLPDGTLVFGGHDHLRFVHAEGATRYVHIGSWNRALGLAGIAGDGAITLRDSPVESRGEPEERQDAAHAALVRAVMADHAAPEDREVLFTLPAPLPLPQAARRAAGIMARAAGANMAVINHTTFGTGLPAGPVTRLAFDAFLRFDGPILRATADARAMGAMAPRLNQDEPVALPSRIGDFAYADVLPAGLPVTVAANGWVAMNAARYLGGDALRFERVPDTAIKPLVSAALRGT